MRAVASVASGTRLPAQVNGSPHEIGKSKCQRWG